MRTGTFVYHNRIRAWVLVAVVVAFMCGAVVIDQVAAVGQEAESASTAALIATDGVRRNFSS